MENATVTTMGVNEIAFADQNDRVNLWAVTVK